VYWWGGLGPPKGDEDAASSIECFRRSFAAFTILCETQ